MLVVLDLQRNVLLIAPLVARDLTSITDRTFGQTWGYCLCQSLFIHPVKVILS